MTNSTIINATKFTVASIDRNSNSNSNNSNNNKNEPQTSNDDDVMMRTSRTSSSRSLTLAESAFCGATAGVISRAVVAPFDVVKITLQLGTNRRTFHYTNNSGVFACASRILQREGIRGFFKGNLSAEYLYLAYGATQFLVFGTIESVLKRKAGFLPKRARSFIGGSLAGAIATTATYPLDLLRTRFVAQEMSRRVHHSILGAISQIYTSEGLAGFYRGLWPACLQIMPYMGIVFTSYDVLAATYTWSRHRVFTSDTSVTRSLDSMQDALIGGTAAVIGKTCVYPLDLVRKRLQIQGPQLSQYANGTVPKYTGMSNAFLYIARNEGSLSLFRGLTPALVKAAPASAVVFYIFGITRDMVLNTK